MAQTVTNTNWKTPQSSASWGKDKGEPTGEVRVFHRQKVGDLKRPNPPLYRPSSLSVMSAPLATNILCPSHYVIGGFSFYRCKSFQNAKRGELCRIPGSSVTPPAQPGGPAPIRLPHVQGSVFRQFILYVYTGKILLQDSAVFEMLSLATDLGVEELRSTCEDYVTSTLSPLNAATFLAAVMDIQERTAGRFDFEQFLNFSLYNWKLNTYLK